MEKLARVKERKGEKEREREGAKKKSEGARGGRREAAQKRWPNLPPQPISPTLGSVARIQDDLYVIPAIWNCNTQRSNSFRGRVHCTRRDTYVRTHVYDTLRTEQLHALCYYVGHT